MSQVCPQLDLGYVVRYFTVTTNASTHDFGEEGREEADCKGGGEGGGTEDQQQAPL